ncbi:MAG: ATP-binding protein [Candidatus Methylacidiphilales bacterium]|nr:ATP-binding protein [Candidatus Methylacidiphilales bacterium]
MKHHVQGFNLDFVRLSFTNRSAELKELDAAEKHGGMLILFGRRRVGKTRLLTQWLASRQGLYSQAIEGSLEIQLEQVFRDIQDQLGTSLTPKTWSEFFELITLLCGADAHARQKKPLILCLDEFPYLVASDPTLPSVLQRWVDHRKPENMLLILSGSSTRMMNDLFLNRAAPLYGRARKLLHIEPMSYAAFCDACGLDPAEQESFTRYSLVGGIPKYWEFIQPEAGAIDLANELFFGFAPYLDQEPARVLRDEGIAGTNAIALLEVIGRGSEKPSEMAARLNTAQTNLSRLLTQLLDVSVLTREVPFGESLRSTKRIHYFIQDPTLRFWFRVYSPHRTRWTRYSEEEKRKLLRDHASTVFEEYCRKQHPDAARYWENNVEFDFLRLEDDPTEKPKLIVTEVKWKYLTEGERAHLHNQLSEKWMQCKLRDKYPNVSFEVLDADILRNKHY